MSAPLLAGLPAGPDDLTVWPASTARLPQGHVSVGGVSLADVADCFGTPAYVVDEGEIRGRCRMYRAAFPQADVVYAAKAFLSRAMVRWIDEEGLGLDVCSSGELELAHVAGFPPERMVLHGNAKSPHDIERALRIGVGRIVVDSPSEIARIAALVGPAGRQKVMVRVVPGVSAGGHEKIRTGTDRQKFGLSLADGSAQHAIARVLGQSQLQLTGLHCHIGSQITDIKPYLVSVRRMVGLMARIKDGHGVTFPELDLGGGHGVAYRPGEPALDLTAPRPPSERGPLRELRGGRAACAEPVTAMVVGRHCEAGDVIASDVLLPGDIRSGDLVAVPVAGAYQVSMASAYNLVGRPPVVAVHGGTARLLIRRETQEDFRRRDVGA